MFQNFIDYPDSLICCLIKGLGPANAMAINQHSIFKLFSSILLKSKWVTYCADNFRQGSRKKKEDIVEYSCVIKSLYASMHINRGSWHIICAGLKQAGLDQKVQSRLCPSPAMVLTQHSSPWHSPITAHRQKSSVSLLRQCTGIVTHTESPSIHPSSVSCCKLVDRNWLWFSRCSPCPLTLLHLSELKN